MAKSAEANQGIQYEARPLQRGYAGYKFRPVGESGWDMADRFELEELLALTEEEIAKLGSLFRPTEKPVVVGRKFFEGDWNPPYSE